MVIKKLLSLFSNSKKKSKTSHSSSAVSGGKCLEDIVGFVDYVVRALVDDSAAVKVELKKTNKAQIININCNRADIGKVIGKGGKTIMAIRSLVSGAASRISQQVSVEVMDQVAD